MYSKKPKILLVMHELPTNSSFLAAKFILLSNECDISVMGWGNKADISAFIAANNLSEEYKKRVFIGGSGKNTIAIILKLLFLFFTNSKLRSFLFAGNTSFTTQLKLAILYWPVFYVRPDIIHFEFGTIAKKGVALKNIPGIKLSSSFRGYDLNYAGLEEKDYYKEVWEKMDGVHFLGSDLKHRAIDRGYKPIRHEVLISPAVDTSFFQRNERVKELKLLNIISVGRLVWKKGFEYGINAMKMLKDKGILFHYTIIGEGPHRQALQFAINELGLENEVTLLGEKDSVEIKTELEASNIFLHPAISEGFSNAVIEAQAMGLPVVCSDADGLSENIENGITGIVVPKWNAAAIADKLEWLHKNPTIVNEMGRAGVKRAKEKYDVNKQVADWVSFYQNLYES
ncbi:MAG: glycosyltransferase [Bacteroidetes bacterium]|nr:glycosyltransferase [Bacteroidota bacterium]